MASMMRHFRQGLAWPGLAVLVLLLIPLEAAAHSSRQSSGDLSGIPVPSVTHGEMAVLADYRDDIQSLARQVQSTDPVFQALRAYGMTQFAHCFWGWAPGAIADENSPFNECAHAYLAADKALLMHMRGMEGAPQSVGALVSEIDFKMVQNGASLIGCEYSGESFNTAEFITPHWEKLPQHGLSLLVLGMMGSALLAAALIRNSLANSGHGAAH